MIISIKQIIKDYETVIKVVNTDAQEQHDRAYGGFVRAAKGKLQEYITENIVKIAWNDLGGKTDRLTINKHKIKLHIQNSYIEKLSNENVKKYIREHIVDYYYGLSVDKHVFIDDKFVMAIECKAYTENAMVKRILVDFHLLKTLYPGISCHLFQLESQLGGDYSSLPKTVYGSKSTHSIMSYFEDVDLHITTLLKGERSIDNPIHRNFKSLEEDTIVKAIEMIKSFLKGYI